MIPARPLYRNDGIPILPLSPFQSETLAIVRGKIESGDLRLIPNPCICGNPDPESDWVISEKDRYGLPIAMRLCGKCGVIRCDRIFDPESNLVFYRDLYRSLYVGSRLVPEAFFKEQINRGMRLADAYRRHVSERAGLIFEVGCGAGGILVSFRELADSCAGCDFDRNYLDYGVSKGLRLSYGDFEEALADGSADVLILSHVLEHFSDPIGTTEAIVRKLKPGGHLLIEVPGILNLHRVYFDPILYFQNAHYFNFCAAQLRVFARTLGMEVVEGDETSIFLMRKPQGWSPPGRKFSFDPELAAYPDIIRRYLVRTFRSHRLGTNPHRWKSAALKAIRGSALNRLRRKLLGKEPAVAEA